MKPRVIKTEEEYEEALARVAELMDAAPGSAEEDELELFALLVEHYEQEHWPIDLPDPVDAIEFRMDQAGLTRKDLEKYLGSASKVSEVLSRKRPLSTAMMRALHEGLGIPAEVLLQQRGKDLPAARYNPGDFPFSEMFKRGYFRDWAQNLREAKTYGEDLISQLLRPLENRPPQLAYCRRAAREINLNALMAWEARALALAGTQAVAAYDPGALDERFFRRLIAASYHAEGPRLVPAFLAKHGIHFVLLGHLDKTYLDGACFMTASGHPVVGLTLRHDRLDNFWFTLLHELAHVKLHLRFDGPGYFDETDNGGCPEDEPFERQADAFTRDILIPPHIWEKDGPALCANPQEWHVAKVAESLEISPAIVAGRIRYETCDYMILSSLVGSGEVRRLFQDLYRP